MYSIQKQVELISSFPVCWLDRCYSHHESRIYVSQKHFYQVVPWKILQLLLRKKNKVFYQRIIININRDICVYCSNVYIYGTKKPYQFSFIITRYSQMQVEEVLTVLNFKRRNAELNEANGTNEYNNLIYFVVYILHLTFQNVYF